LKTAEVIAMKSYVFQVVVEEDLTEDGAKAYHAFCPALKGCHTWGRTYDEALANAREAIELYLEDLRESGQEVPVDPGHGALEWPTAAVAVNMREGVRTRKRSSRKPEELRKAAGHVRYEIRMLIFAAEHVGGWHSSPMTSPEDDEKNISYSRADYIEAQSYGWDSSAMLVLLLNELQKFLSHLTDEQRDWFPNSEELERAVSRAQFEVNSRGGAVDSSTVTAHGPFRLGFGNGEERRDSAGRGDLLEHDEVVERIEKMFRS
jgi:predicted RNase H-like HicB family nuclease